VEARAEVACRGREKARGPDTRRKCHKVSRRKSDRIKKPIAQVPWRKGLSHKVELLTWLEGLEFKIRHRSSFSPQLFSTIQTRLDFNQSGPAFGRGLAPPRLIVPTTFTCRVTLI